MSKVTIAKWYDRVMATWPAAALDQKPTDDEAIKAARKLFRFAMGESFKDDVSITRGRRYSYYRRHAGMRVNPEGIAHGKYGGWVALVHDLSHSFAYYLDPHERPHSAHHDRLEIRMIKEVVKRGWLGGSLQTSVGKEPAPDLAKLIVRTSKIAALERRLEGWGRKQKRAANAITKINRSLAAYARNSGGK